VAKVETGTKKPNAVVRYFRETSGELRKVTWPTRQEARRLTTVVVIVVAVTSAVLGAFDFGFARLIGLIVSIGAGTG
jgi:preprotein translocase subunit SecE